MEPKKSDRGKLGVHILVVIFGITSWSIMNGLWVELPMLVSHLPEGWTLPSYLTIISQFGNMGPIVFSLLVYLRPQAKIETSASILIVVMLSLCSLFYSFFWQETAYVAGNYHSVAVLTLTLCQSVFACTTSMAYLALMAHLQAQYMGSIFIGMGFSGLIPAFAAMGQGDDHVKCVSEVVQTVTVSGSGDPLVSGATLTSLSNGSLYYTDPLHSAFTTNNSIIVTAAPSTTTSIPQLVAVEEEPDFSVKAFFLLLFGLGMASLVALLLLLYHPFCQAEHVDTSKEDNCQLMHTQGHNQENSKLDLNHVEVDSERAKNSLTSASHRDPHTDHNSSLVDHSGWTGHDTEDRKLYIQGPTSNCRWSDEESTRVPGEIQNVHPLPRFHNRHGVDSGRDETTAPLLTSPDSTIDHQILLDQKVSTHPHPFTFAHVRTENAEGITKEKDFEMSELKLQDLDGDLCKGPYVSRDFVDTENNHSNGQELQVKVKGTSCSLEQQTKVADASEVQLTRLQSWCMLGLLVWINLIFTSFGLAIQVYSSLPYGLIFYHAVTKARNSVHSTF